MSEVLDQIRENIVQSVGTASSVSVDGTSVTQRSISDQVQAAEFLAKSEASKKPMGGIKFYRGISPGAV